MSRSKWKGPFLNYSLLILKRKLKLKLKRRSRALNLIHIWSRNSIIPQFLVGQKVAIYTGKFWRRIVITQERVGFKFGEFADTRKHTKHTSRRVVKKIK